MTPHGVINVSGWEQLSRKLLNKSAFLTLMCKLLSGVGRKAAAGAQQKKKGENSGDWLAHNWTGTIQQNVDYSMWILGLTIKMLQDHDVKVVLTGVPHFPQYIGEWSAKPHDVLKKTSKKYDCHYLESFRILKEYICGPDVTKYYWKNDPTHFNEEGNALWAKAHLDFLFENQNSLLP